MVVVCGTATTIDFLTADGVFKGGMIMPGLGLMLRSLHEGTAALPDQDGDFSPYPTQTVDAIASGCQHAQAGTIERLYAMESRSTPERRVPALRRRGGRGRAAPVDSLPAAREPGARRAVSRQPRPSRQLTHCGRARRRLPVSRMSMLFDPQRHESLAAMAWDDSAARAWIARYADDAQATFSREHLWPTHPRDAG